MEDTFNQLKKNGQNNVDNLVCWMKDSKIVDGVKVTEANVRKLFEDVKDKENVELEKFQQAISTLAAEQKKKAEEFTTTLAAEGTKFLSAVAAAAAAASGAAAAAFKQAMEKK
ncbi:uncharacterized protein LOC123871008 [Maniola jurtina]|uniref:uncharacterized protein LOC123871008 n=1 Tax=Maniola jurtina TaxID=191418 RepID=UPI001E68F5D6|nr:uncharacterized protein LOC123871008 [Maniola jurtina]